MKTVYCDSNFWVRLFVEFPESRAIRAEMEGLRAGDELCLPLTWLHRVEVTNAFNLLVFQSRAGRFPRVTSEQAAIALENFRELASGNSFAVNQPLYAADLEPQVVALSERHTARHGFRAYDLLHVSSALLLDCATFWSFDQKASKLAALEGLRVRKVAARKLD